MDNPVKYIVMPSLQDMAVVQIAVAMWKHTDVKYSVIEILRSESYLTGEDRSLFDSALYEVIENVEQLKQPEEFQEKIKNSIRFIGREICKCVNFYLKISLNQSNIDLHSHLCFTPLGTLDRKKTAEMIARDENLDINLRYKWACVYCLKDDIWELWNKMSENCQLSILNECCRNELHQAEGNREGYDEEDDNPERYAEDVNGDEEEVNLEDCDDGVNPEDYDEEAINRGGYDEEGVNPEDYDQEAINLDESNEEEVSLKDYVDEGVNPEDYDQEAINRDESNEEEVSLKDYDDEGVNPEDYDEEAINRGGYDEEGVFQVEQLQREAFLETGYTDELEQTLNDCNNELKYSRNMVRLWTIALKKEQLDYTLSFPYLSDIFECSVKLSNKAAIEYFLQGLEDRSTVERFCISALECFLLTVRDHGFLCFLLSKMTEEQQLKVFKHFPYEILLCFLHCPHQHFFLETAGRVYDFLSPEMYKSLLGAIIFTSIEVFGEFWQKSPTELKRYIANDILIPILLIEINDTKNSVLIIRDTATILGEEFINFVRRVCNHFLVMNKWSSLKFFIGKCLLENSSQDEILKFKEDLENDILLTTCLKEKNLKFEQAWDEILKESNCEEGFF